MPLKFAHRKKQGEWAELMCQTKAAGLGMTPCKPWGESAPYDTAIEGHKSHRFHRVQVKSVGGPKSDRPGLYRVVCQRGNPNCQRRRPYSPKEVDFLAVYLISEDLWYIIPIRALRGVKMIHIRVRDPKKASRFERYREAWHLLY
jgi:hypothetical protein